MAGLLHRALGGGPPHPVEHRHPERPLLHPVAGKLAPLGLAEDLANRLLVDHAGAAGADRKLGRTAAPPADVFLDAHLVHHVDHAAERADRLGIGEARRIAVVHHRLEAHLHQVDRAAVEDLLLEVVAFGLVLERHLHHAGPRAAHRLGHGQGDLHGVAGGVVIHRHAAVDALAGEIFLPHEVARRVGHEEHRVDVFRRLDRAVEHVEAVAEADRLAGRQIGGDLGLPDRRLGRIGQFDEQHVGELRGFADRAGLEAVGLGLLAAGRLAGGPCADDHVHAAVAGVGGLGLALNAVADHGHGLALQRGHVNVGVAVDFFLHDVPRTWRTYQDVTPS